MDINQYQDEALKTAVFPADMRIIYPTLGLAGETGEVADKVKKEIRDHNAEFSPEARQEIAKELGDVLWYMANLAHALGYTLEDIAQINIKKIQSRQRRGQIHGQGDNR